MHPWFLLCAHVCWPALSARQFRAHQDVESRRGCPAHCRHVPSGDLPENVLEKKLNDTIVILNPTFRSQSALRKGAHSTFCKALRSASATSFTKCYSVIYSRQAFQYQKQYLGFVLAQLPYASPLVGSNEMQGSFYIISRKVSSLQV
jgi:hypothetical protein